MKLDVALLASLVAELKSLIAHDLAASSQAAARRPLTANWYKGIVQDSADESVRDEMDSNEAAIYEALQELEAEGWDGLRGLEDYEGPFDRKTH
jgi:hypothetical protein